MTNKKQEQLDIKTRNREASKLAVFSKFKTLGNKEESTSPDMDPETGKIKTWAYVGSVMIK